MTPPVTRYARSGDVNIAYQVIDGDGPLDVVFVHGFVGNMETQAEEPRHEAWFQRLASLGRVIRFDRRGTGLSDRVREVPTLEARMDDLRAVMDAVASRRAALFATFEAASMAIVYAATYPERIAALVLYNPIAKGVRSPDYPWGQASEAEWESTIDDVSNRWGTREYAAEFLQEMGPSIAGDPEMVEWIGRVQRLGASPGAAEVILRMAMTTDVRDVLSSIRVPTLVLYRAFRRGEATFVAERIPNARAVEIGGSDTMYWLADGLADEIVAFLEGITAEAAPDTVLATILFTDIVDSSKKAVELGDRAWADLVQRHHAVVRAQLDRFHGRELDTAGDGFFAAFDGPIRAIHCATAIRGAVGDLGLDVRAGLHAGECEVVGEKLGGFAVIVGARVVAVAGPGEILVSSTVKDLVAGSGIEFEERGATTLKGLPDEWRLFAVR
jgi:class 3 adenylate cyclase/alpha-beta hydrolase superfamily lysophospholipase